MSIQIGDINIANEIIELHYQILRTQFLLQSLADKNPDLNHPTAEEVSDIEAKAIEILQKKFPKMGIKRK